MPVDTSARQADIRLDVVGTGAAASCRLGDSFSLGLSLSYYRYESSARGGSASAWRSSSGNRASVSVGVSSTASS